MESLLQERPDLVDLLEPLKVALSCQPHCDRLPLAWKMRCVWLVHLTLALARSCRASQTLRQELHCLGVPPCLLLAVKVYKACVEILDIMPDQCLVIEDAPAGVKAAKAAGCFTVAVPEAWMEGDVEGEQVLASADLRLKSLEDFQDSELWTSLFGHSRPLLVACGNATVDVICTFETQRLASFGLSAGMEAAGMSDSVKQTLVDIAKDQPGAKVVAGGSAMNTVRVAAWSAGERIRASFIGAVGRDEHGKILEQALHDVDVVPLLQKVTSQTGICGCLVDIITRDRTLAAVRGASGHLDPSWIHQPGVKALIQEASLLYVTSFVLTTQPRIAAIEATVELAMMSGARLAVNLSSAGIVEKVQGMLQQLLPKAHFVFGNLQELRAWAQLRGWNGSDKEMADKLACMLRPGGMAVVTAGANPTMIARTGFEVQLFPVHPNQSVQQALCGVVIRLKVLLPH